MAGGPALAGSGPPRSPRRGRRPGGRCHWRGVPRPRRAAGTCVWQVAPSGRAEDGPVSPGAGHAGACAQAASSVWACRGRPASPGAGHAGACALQAAPSVWARRGRPGRPGSQPPEASRQRAGLAVKALLCRTVARRVPCRLAARRRGYTGRRVRVPARPRRADRRLLHHPRLRAHLRRARRVGDAAPAAGQRGHVPVERPPARRPHRADRAAGVRGRRAAGPGIGGDGRRAWWDLRGVGPESLGSGRRGRAGGRQPAAGLGDRHGDAPGDRARRGARVDGAGAQTPPRGCGGGLLPLTRADLAGFGVAAAVALSPRRSDSARALALIGIAGLVSLPWSVLSWFRLAPPCRTRW